MKKPVTIGFFDILYPLAQYATAIDILADFSVSAEAEAKYGDKMTLIGCVTPSSAIIGSVENWDRERIECIYAMTKDGSVMLATSCEYHAAATFDHALRMIDIANTYGLYAKEPR